MLRRILSFILSFLIMVSSLSSISNIIASALTDDEDEIIVSEPTPEPSPEPEPTPEPSPAVPQEPTPAGEQQPSQSQEQLPQGFADFSPLSDTVTDYDPPVIDLSSYNGGKFYIKDDGDCHLNLTSVSSDSECPELKFEIETSAGNISGTAEIKTDNDTGDKIFKYTPNSTVKSQEIKVRVTNRIEGDDGKADGSYTIFTLYIYVYAPLPVLSDAAIDTPESTTGTLDLASHDVRGNKLSYSVETAPEHGAASVPGATLSYEPEENYYGTDSLEIKVRHEDTNSPYDEETFTVSIVVEFTENAPIAVDDSDSVDSNGSVLIDVLDNDIPVEKDPQTGDYYALELAGIVAQPSYGTATITDENKILYKPFPRESGGKTDTFEYSVRHEGGEITATATVSIYINKVNSAHELRLEKPVAETDEDIPLTFSFFVDDIDSEDFENDFLIELESGNTGVFSEGAVAAALSSITITKVDNDTYKYTVVCCPVENANTDEHGPAYIIITVTDTTNTDHVATARQEITVNPVNDDPGITIKSITNTITDDSLDFGGGSVTILEDEAIELVFEVYDPDVTNPPDSFSVTVTSDTATANVFGTIVRTDAQYINSRTARYTYRLIPKEDANCADGVTITITARDEASHGAARGTGTADFLLIIEPVNDPPIANDDTFTEEGVDAPKEDLPTVLDVLKNDIDVDGKETISIIAAGRGSREAGVTEPGVTDAIGDNGDRGTVKIVDESDVDAGHAKADQIGLILYTSPLDYNGYDSFWYTISDGEYTSTAYVTIRVEAVNDPPEILPDYSSDNNWVSAGGYFLGSEDNNLRIRIFVNDIETPQSALMLQARAVNDPDDIVPSSSQVYVEEFNPLNPLHNHNERFVVVEPSPDMHSTGDNVITIQLTLGDGVGGRSILNINVRIEPDNDPPVATGKDFRFPEHKPGFEPVFISIESLMEGNYDIDTETNDDPPPVFDESFDMNATLSQSGASLSSIYTKDGVRGFDFNPVLHSESNVTFKYQIKDGVDPSMTVQATVTMRPIIVNDPPYITPFDELLTNRTFTIYEDSIGSIENGTNVLDLIYEDFETENRLLNVTFNSSQTTIINLAGIDFLGATGNNKDAKLAITPIANMNTEKSGPVRISVSVSDGERMSSDYFYVVVLPVPDTPVANDDFYINEPGGNNNSAIAGRQRILRPLQNDFDWDEGDVIRLHGDIEVLSAPAGAAAAGIEIIKNPDNTLIFMAPKGYPGIYKLGYTITDDTYDETVTPPSLRTASATITIEVTSFGLAPTIVPVSPQVRESGTEVSITLELESYPEIYSIAAYSLHPGIIPNSALSVTRMDDSSGTAAEYNLSGGVHELVVSIPENVSGTPTIIVELRRNDYIDDDDDSDIYDYILIYFTIELQNASPIANNDRYDDPEFGDLFTLDEGVSRNINVLINDWDEIPDSLMIIDVTQPRVLTINSEGAEVVSDTRRGETSIVSVSGKPHIRYVHHTSNYRPFFNGYVTFDYTIMDIGGKTSTGTVVLKIRPMPTAPWVYNDYFSFMGDAPDYPGIPAGTPITIPSRTGEDLSGLTGILLNDLDNDDMGDDSKPEMSTAVVLWGGNDGKLVNDNGTYDIWIYTGETSAGETVDEDGSGEDGFVLGWRRLTETEYNALNVSFDDNNNLVIKPVTTGWYRVLYSIETQNVTSEPPHDSTAWLKSNETYVYLAVKLIDDDLPLLLNSNTYERAEDTGINSEGIASPQSINVTGLIRTPGTTGEISIVDSYILLPNDEKIPLDEYNGIITDADLKIVYNPATQTNTATLTYKHVKDAFGDVDIYWTVRQNGISSNEGRIRLSVYNINDAPEFGQIDLPGYIPEHPAGTVYRGDPITMVFDVWDADKETINFRVNSDNDAIISSYDISLTPVTTTANPGHYTVTLKFTAINYDADNDTVTITIFANDGKVTTEQKIEITVLPKNTPPVVMHLQNGQPFEDFTLLEDDKPGEYDVVAWGYDADGDRMHIVYDPADDDETGIFFYDSTTEEYSDHTTQYGDVWLNVRKIMFQPVKDYYTQNPDDFIEIRYKLFDGEDESDDIGIIRIRVLPVNDPPEIFDLMEGYTMEEDAIYPTFSFRVRDIDTPDLTKDNITFTLLGDAGEYIKSIEIVSWLPQNGNEYYALVAMEFVENAHHNESNTLDRSNIMITADDRQPGGNNISTAEFYIRIEAVNDPVHPKADAPELYTDVPFLKALNEENGKVIYFMEMDEDEVNNNGIFIDITKLFDDIDGKPDEIFLFSLDNVRHGTASNNSNRVHFTPTRDFFHDAADEWNKDVLAMFDFTVTDPYEGRYSSTVYMFINPVNDNPVAPDFTVQATEDTPLYISPILANRSRARDVDNDLEELDIIEWEVLDGSGEVFYVPAGKDIIIEYEEGINAAGEPSGEIIITRNELVTSSATQPYPRLYYVPGIDENSSDHGPAANNGAFRISYTVTDNNSAVKPFYPNTVTGIPGTDSGTISVNIRSVHDAPRLNLEVDTIWVMYEDNEYRYYFTNGSPDPAKPIDANAEHQSPFPLRMWTPEERVGLNLKCTAYNYDNDFWTAWTSNADVGGDISDFDFDIHRKVIRSENIVLGNAGTFGDPLKGYRELHLIPELNEYGQLILELRLDDLTYETVTYVKVVVMPVNDVPELYVVGETPAGENIYGFEIDEGETLRKDITGSDVETPLSELTFRVPTGGDEEAWNAPAHTLSELLPSNGTVEVKQRSDKTWYFDYTPDDFYYGTDSFYLVAEDKALTLEGWDTLDSERGYTRIDVTILNINQPPSTPVITKVDSHPHNSYKDGEDITVFFTPSTDYFSERNETLDEDLTYFIEVTYNGTWAPGSVYTVGSDKKYSAGEIASGELSYTFTPPLTGQNTDSFRIRIYAKDTVTGTGSPQAETSDYGYSDFIKIDNTPPAFDHELIKSTFTNQDVTIILTVTDTAAGSTGVSKVYFTDAAGTIIPANEISVSPDGKYRRIVEYNGTYYFRAEDKIGNISPGVYSVSVTNIDKLDPDVTAGPAAIVFNEHHTVNPLQQVGLTYSDDVSGTYNHAVSDVDFNRSRYILTKNPELPADTDTAWITTDDYTHTVDLKTKGIWYIHAVVTDYAGNTVTKRFGPYEINNSLPYADDGDYNVQEAVYTWNATLEVYEEKPGTVTIDFEQHVRDNDGWGDIAAITPSNLPSADYGELTETGTFGVYEFTHSGEGKDPFEKVLTFDYTATDVADGEIGGVTTDPATITINVIEVNDPPSAPVDVEAQNENYSFGNASANEVELSWGASTDEEELSSELKYQVQVRYREGASGTGSWGAWTGAGETAKGVVTFNYNVPDGLTGEMQFRVRAVDNGKSADGEDDLGVMWSGYAVSAVHNLDNAPPVVTHSPAVFDYTNENITFTLTVTEQRIGDTGIDSVGYIGDKTITFTPGSSNTAAKHVYTVTVPVNDTYEFEVTDAVGNSQVYSVTIDTIDKLYPYVTADIEKIDYEDDDLGKVYAKQKSVTLTYLDKTATADYAMSGVAERYYVIDNNAAAPASGSSAWKPYTAAIPLDTKGEWYIHYKVIDEAGNEVTGTFGCYQINNSLPVAQDALFEVWEHDLDGDRNSVTIKLRDLVTDVDGADDITGFVVTPDPEMAAHGTWTGNSITGIYTFTHNGKGNPFVDEFVVEYYALDKSGDGDSRENNKDTEGAGQPNKITIGVTEINDPPKAPVNITPKAPLAYKDGDTAELSWDIPVDAGGMADIDEETEPGDIIYELQVSYDGGATWPDDDDFFTTLSPGEEFYSFEVDTSGINGLLHFRIRTNDGGYSAAGTQTLTPKKSSWAYSDIFNLDNKYPELSYTLESDTDTNEDVVITVTVTDGRAGDTGIKSVTSPSSPYAGDLTAVDTTDPAEHVYTLTAEQNGTYYFTVVDEKDNKYTYPVTVGNIDRLPPAVTADPPHLIGEANAVYSLLNETVELTYDDAPGTSLNKKSGVVKVEFIKEQTDTERDVTDPDNAPAKPSANDTRWGDYDGIGIPLNRKGKWIIHVKVTDAAGNVTVESFGTYLVLNHNPVTINGTEYVYEEELIAGDGKNTVIIDLFDYATDPDDAFNPGGKSDIVEFIVTQSSAMKEHGTLTEYWDTTLPDPTDDPDFGKYIFTHNGKGNPFIDRFEMTFVAIDNDGNTSTESESDDSTKPPSVITIRVTEVNDAPTAPRGILPPARAYKDGMTVNLSWTASEDEETETGKLVYEIDVLYSETGSWVNIHTTLPGETSFDYQIPDDGYLGTMQFRIRAADDGYAADKTTQLGVKKSVYTLSPVYRLSYGPLAAKDGEVTVREHAVSPGSDENAVVIDLHDFITNISTYAAGDLIFSVTQTPDPAFGTWARLSEGVYKFTHNGSGAHPFTDKLYVSFCATDGDGFVSLTETITIKVQEVNDKPSDPSQLKASAAAFKDGSDVTLTWNASTDEETAAADLIYHVEVRYDNGLWEPLTPAGTTAPGVTTIDCTIDYPPPGNGTVSFRVQAEDNHATLSSETSDRIQIGPLVVDNTAPDFDYEFTVGGEPYNPGDPAVEEVDITVDFTDDGGSGLYRYGYALTLDETPPQDALSGPDLSAYTMLTKPLSNAITCPGIGQFFLHLYAVDNAGNERFLTVNPPDEPIDVLNTRPVAANKTVTVNKGGNVEIILSGFDKDPGDEIDKYIIEKSVKYGKLQLANGKDNVYIYTHDDSEPVQDDSFTFTVTDVSFGVKSHPASVTIIVNAPQAEPKTPASNGGNGNGNYNNGDEVITDNGGDGDNGGSGSGTGNGIAGDDDTVTDDDGDTVTAEIIPEFGAVDEDGNPTPPGGTVVPGVSVFQYGKGSLILVVQSAENDNLHQNSQVMLTDPHEAITSILSKEDLEHVLNGARIEIRVTVDYIRQDAHQDEKVLIEAAVDEYANDYAGLTVGEYLDITVEYRYEGEPFINVTETNGEIELCIDISKDLRKTNTQSYYILRSHDGEVALLYDLDNNPETITFKTAYFSLYAKAYIRPDPAARPCLLCGHCPEPLGICMYIWLVAFLTNTAIMVYTDIRNKKRGQFESLIPEPVFPLF